MNGNAIVYFENNVATTIIVSTELTFSNKNVAFRFEGGLKEIKLSDLISIVPVVQIDGYWISVLWYQHVKNNTLQHINIDLVHIQVSTETAKDVYGNDIRFVRLDIRNNEGITERVDIKVHKIIKVSLL